MKMNFMSSNFTDEIQRHYDSSDPDVLPPSSSEEEKIDKTRKYQREYHRKCYKEKQQRPYMCRICGKLFPTSLIPKDMQSSKMYRRKNQCLVKIDFINNS